MTRRGFSLMELLVVVALIAVLVALLLPATRRVRGAAARSVCANHLKQIGLAAHAYADTHGTLPPGTVPNPALPPDRRLGWYAELLPYLEQAGLARRLDRAGPWDSAANAAAVGVAHPAVLRCPSLPDAGLGLTGYVGVAGLGPDAAELPTTDPRVGALGYDRRLALKEVTDGTASTALAAETVAGTGPWLSGGPATVRGVTPDRPPGGAHVGDRRWFWEDRPVGSNVLLADGSVRYLPDGTPPAVWAALATAAGGEGLPVEW